MTCQMDALQASWVHYFGNTYGRLNEPHPFRHTNEIKVHAKLGLKYGTGVSLMCFGHIDLGNGYWLHFTSSLLLH